jgi:uncharacterized protein YjiS (DUF1127 family)
LVLAEETEMSVYEVNRQVPLGSVATFRVVSLVDSAIVAVRAWRAARATEKTLFELSDAQLADIGLHRGAIGEVAEALARR